LSHGSLVVPGLRFRKNSMYARVAEVNIGNLVTVHELDRLGECSEIYANEFLVYKAMDFAVDQINRRRDLLPNITVGFVQLDDCNNDLKALEVSMYFVREEGDQMSTTECVTATENPSNEKGIRPFNVVGIIGPEDSINSVVVSKFIGTFELPVMSTYATANELSDKKKYPFFMRLVPPDSVEETAIIEV